MGVPVGMCHRILMATTPDAIPTARKVDFLRRPEVWPTAPERIEVVETHMAWVFLGDRRVYKLKKPVHYAFLDFRTLAARRHTCAEEVRLNRRLAPDIYLGTVPLTVGAAGALALGGRGAVVDWLVCMRRLPSAKLLDRALLRGDLTPAEVEPVARRLARFYADAPREPVSGPAYLARLRGEADRHLQALAAPDLGLPRERLGGLARGLGGAMTLQAAMIEARAPAFLEGHGDLRPEHVCLDPPVIIDCLEFDRNLRLVDPLDEISFLTLECGRLGAGWVGEVFLRATLRATGSDAPPPLLALYRALRACVRAKLSIWHLRDGARRDGEAWRRRALAYLDLAEAHLADAQRC